MDKRLLIVLPLCFLILIGWRYLFAPKPVPHTPGANTAAQVSPANPPNPSGSGLTPTESKAAEAKAASAEPEPPAEPSLPRVADTEAREEVLLFGKPGATGSYRAVFTNVGGGLRELKTGAYFDRAALSPAEQEAHGHWVTLLGDPRTETKAPPLSFALRTLPNSAQLQRTPLENELWVMKVLEQDGVKEGVEFTLAPGTGVTFTKRFRFVPGKNQFVFEVELQNDALAAQGGAPMFGLTPVAWMDPNSGDGYYPEPQAAAGYRKNAAAEVEVESIKHDPSGGELSGTLAPSTTGETAFAGVHGKYFAVLLAPEQGASKCFRGAQWRKVQDPLAKDPANPWTQIVADAQFEIALPKPGERTKVAFDVYAGPKDPGALTAANPDFAALHRYDLGWLRFIAAPLLLLLEGLHWLCSSWGVAIVLLTLLVRIVLFPLNRRSQTAMARYSAKMKRLQPKIEELKKRYEHDASKLRTEQARLMQQEGAFPPLGGCLPMFLQMPVFFGLYTALGISFDLRQQPFVGWITDLALPDRTWEIGLHLWPFGVIQYLNILPPLMVGLWIWQQKMMPAPADEQAAKMQKMMMFMPVMMGVFLYNYAAGLSLYMITQSGLAIFEMKIIRKYWPIDDKEPPKKQNGFWSKMMALQEQAEAQKRGKSRAR